MSAQPALDRLVVAAAQRDVLVVTGSEAGAYLHGQVSADVEAMEIGQSALSFLLEPRGRIEAFFVISRTGPETYVADTDAGFGDAMTTSLERFKLRTKATFSLGQWTMRSVRGPRATAELSTGVSAAGSADAPERVTRPAHWPSAGGYDLLMRRDSQVSPSSQVNPSSLLSPSSPVDSIPEGAEAVSAGEFEALRMAYGLPAMGTEIQPGGIPNETGLVEHAASFTKGCYRGQELVERIDSRAGGRRIIRRFRASGQVVAGEALNGRDGMGVGTVLSAAPLAGAVVGFASVQRDAADGVSSDSGQPVALADLF